MMFYYIIIWGLVCSAVHTIYTVYFRPAYRYMLVLVPVMMRCLLIAASLVSACLLSAPVFCALYSTTFLSILVSVTRCVHM